jgi:hypothetical protein
MKQFIKDMGREALKQLFGLQKPRGGKMVLTRHAVQKMTAYKLGVLESDGTRNWCKPALTSQNSYFLRKKTA